ncbi:MAG: sel1 repeat family protein, partial [Methanocorpusculum sp.]|nr:sel1 repeat family protein [Methanocorpusculum sp.]
NAGNLGYIDAIHYIGLCYFKGYGTPSNPERAVEIWQKNVLKKNPLTQYMLGYCYFHGIGIERNRIVARAYLKTAEALGNTDASILLKEDIPSQASSASSAPTHEPGFLKITVRDDKYDIQYENARATVCKQSEGYLFSEKSTIKQNSRYDSQEVIKRRKSWEFARLLVPQEPDLLVLWVDQNSRLTSISQVVEFISGKKIHIPDEASLNLMKEWKRGDPVIEYPLFPKDKVTGTNPPDKNKVTETDLPTEYAEYQNVTDEYARAVFFLVESLITDNPIKGKYFQAGREKLVRLAKSGNKPANELLNSLLDNDKYQLLSPEMDIRTSRSILDSLYPETRYQIFFTGANCGGIRAKIELGKCYRDGVGVIVDTKKAEFWFLSAAQRGNEEAKTLLRQLKPSPSKPVQQETSRSQPSTAPRPQFDSSFVLFEEADILYKHALAYYVGDITNRTNITKYMNYLRIAEELGSKQAAFLLKTKESFCYTHLEAARYGSKKAEKHISYIASTGRIPVDIVTQYVRYINARTPSDDYYKFSNTSPDIAQKVYQRGLSYWVGDVYSWTDGTKGNEYLRIARDLGSHDAEFILNSEHKRLYIYLEAAKYGSLKAKKKVREWNDKKTFAGKIPDEKLKEYFDKLGISTVGVNPAEEGRSEGKTDSDDKSKKTVIEQKPKNPDELYKEGLAYYVGDKTGRENITRGTGIISDAVEAGSKEAAFSLNSKYSYAYFYLDAAKYGSERAKYRVIELNNAGYLKGRIPEKKLQEYFSKIGITPTSQQKPEEQTKSPAKDTETRKKTATSGTSTKPRTTSVSKDAEESFRRALNLYVGENGICNINRGFAELKAAKNAGHPEAARILESASVSSQIYLAAAKRGSIPARKQIEIWRENGTLTGKISDAELKEYDKIVKKSSAKPEAQKETKEKQLVPEKPSAVKPVPKENTPKPAPKKPKKKTKVVIDK